MADLKRQFQLNNNIIRFQIISLDPRLEETLVQHALAGPAKVEEEETQNVYEEEDEENEAEETAE